MSEETEVVTKSPGSLLADEMYGVPEEKSVQVEEPAAEEAQVEEIEAEPEQQIDEVTEPTDDDTEEVELQTIEQLAEHFEFDPEVMNNLTIKQKVLGKEIDVNLGEALTTHRKVKAADTYLSEAKEKAKGIVEQANNESEYLSSAVITVGTMIKGLEEDLDARIDNADMQALRKADPAEYSAKVEEFRQERQKIDTKRQQAQEALQQFTQMSAQQEEQARLARLPQEQEILLARVPEWADDEKATAERGEVVGYLQAEGFTNEMIEYLSFDGAALATVVKAMRYDKAKGKSDAIKKKVVKIPKVLKPGRDKVTANQGKAKDKDDLVSIMYPEAG